MKRLAALALLIVPAACGGGDNTPEPAPANNSPAPVVDREDRVAKATALLEKGKGLLEAGDAKAALPLLEEAAELDQLSWRIQIELAKAYESLRRFAEARGHYVNVAKRAPGADRLAAEDRAAYCSHQLANDAYRAGQYKVALEHVRDGLKLRPTDADMNLLLGYVQQVRGEYAEAEGAFRLAAELFNDARKREALYWLGQALFAQEKYAETVEVYTGLINQRVTSNDIYGWRAYCHAALGNRAEARRDFAKAIEYATSPEKRAEYMDQASKLAEGG